MKSFEDNELERFIHDQLRKLPDREAPSDLAVNVLAAITRQQQQPWYRQSFTHWPIVARVILLASLASLLGVMAWVVAGPAEQLSTTSIYGQMMSAAWMANVLKAFGAALWTSMQGVAVCWVAAAVVVILAMYGACVAGGLALYRIAVTHSLRHS